MVTATENAPIDPLLTVKDVAKLMQLGVTTVWRYAREKKIPEPCKIGKAVRWRSSEISAWIGAGCPPVDESASAS